MADPRQDGPVREVSGYPELILANVLDPERVTGCPVDMDHVVELTHGSRVREDCLDCIRVKCHLLRIVHGDIKQEARCHGGHPFRGNRATEKEHPSMLLTA